MKRRLTRSVLVLSVLVGFVGAACSKGGTTVDTFGETKDDAIAKLLPSDVASKGSVTVASDASYAPMEFFATDNKTIQGADVDLGHAMGAVLGIDFNFVNAKFDGIIPGLSSGKYDVGMSAFTDNKEREQTVDMVTYFQAGASIFVKAGSGNSFTSLDQLCGKPVSIERGTTELDDATAASKDCTSAGKQAINALVFDDQNGANLAVISGRAVASLADTPVANYQVKVTNGQVKVTGDYLSPAPYGIALPRPSGSAAGTAPLSKAIQAAMQKLIDDGTYKKILDKWGIAAGAIATSAINGATS